MAKSHRGAGIRELPKQGRGTCPVCSRTGIKLLHEREISGKKQKVCKQCNAALKHGTKKAS